MRMIWPSGCLAVSRCRCRLLAVCRCFFAFGGCPEPPLVAPSPVWLVSRGTIFTPFLSMNNPFLSTFRGFLSAYSWLFSCICQKKVVPLWVESSIINPFRLLDYV